MTTQSDAILQLLRRGKLDALLGEGAARGQVLFVRAARSDDRAQRRIERLQREVDELRSFLRTTVHELARPLEALERETAAVADLVERRNAPLWLLDPLRTFRQAALVLDEIAEIKGSWAIVCHAMNPRISDRLFARWGWEPHCAGERGRHFIKRIGQPFRWCDAEDDSPRDRAQRQYVSG